MLLQIARSVHGHLGAFARTHVVAANRRVIEKCDGMAKGRPVVGVHLVQRSQICWNKGVSVVWVCVLGEGQAHFVVVLPRHCGEPLALLDCTWMQTQVHANLRYQSQLLWRNRSIQRLSSVMHYQGIGKC